ncbi:MAG: PHP domain-containing protein [Candidatus Pacebacteria bacterium]|nr:PHP domain-containing protein [Candidatus Paceibacterota bacterium]
MKIDLHCHSYYSWDGSSSPREIIKQALNAGLDGVAITDHETAAAWTEAAAIGSELNAKIIFGEEIKTNKGDILGLFLNKQIDGKGKDPVWVINEIKKQGGVAIIPHPCHGTERFKDDLSKYLNIIDGIEVFNGRLPFSMPDRMAREFAEKNNLAMTGGSDAHYHKGIGTVYTECAAQTLDEFKNCLLNRKSAVHGKKAPLFYAAFPFLRKIGLLKGAKII